MSLYISYYQDCHKYVLDITAINQLGSDFTDLLERLAISRWQP
jgi:hypothetical protein